MKRNKTVVIFGAGATKGCGGPLTNEILPEAFCIWKPKSKQEDNLYKILRQCLIEHFHVPEEYLGESCDNSRDSDHKDRRNKQFPALPLFLSLLDMAIDRNHEFPRKWDRQQLLESRSAVEYAIFNVLDYHLGRHKKEKNHYYREFLNKLVVETGEPPNVISLNYDIIADNELFYIGQEKHGPGAIPDYGCDIKVPKNVETCTYGKLLKLHGSLNWLHCPGCNRLDLAMSKSCWDTVAAVKELYEKTHLGDRLTYKGRQCRDCSVPVRPVLITPTHSKDYRNPHVARVWYHAERLLHEAKRVYIIGYSLPEDDVEVTYLLKRGLVGQDQPKITVVESDENDRKRKLENHPVGIRYRSIFGSKIEWSVEGFEKWENWIA